MSEAPPLLLPKFDYHLDESDPDVLVLRRQEGAFVAAFSVRGATEEGITQATKDDYRALLEEPASPLALEIESLRSQSALAPLTLIHRGAWKGYSANFALSGF